MPLVSIVLTDNFPMLSLTLITEPLRVANRELAMKTWTWRLLSANGGRVVSSSGFEIQTGSLNEEHADIVLLLSSYRPETALVKPLLAWLRRMNRSGAIMGCVDTGALIFRRSGIAGQDTCRCSLRSLERLPGKICRPDVCRPDV